MFNSDIRLFAEFSEVLPKHINSAINESMMNYSELRDEMIADPDKMREFAKECLYFTISRCAFELSETFKIPSDEVLEESIRQIKGITE